jgi:hypothetical protein
VLVTGLQVGLGPAPWSFHPASIPRPDFGRPRNETPFSRQPADIRARNSTHTRRLSAYDHVERLMEVSGIAGSRVGEMADSAGRTTRVCALAIGTQSTRSAKPRRPTTERFSSPS